jgi:hypothetical protein
MASMASRRTAATSESPALSRLVGERLVEAKLRKGETPAEAGPRSTSTLPKPLMQRTTAGSSARSRSQRTVRSRSHSLSTESEPEGSTEGIPQKRRRQRARPPVIRTPEVESDDDDDEWVSRSLESLSKTHLASLQTHAAQRPRLSTILSSDQSGVKGTRGESSTSAAPIPLRDTSNIKTAAGPTSGSADKPRPVGASTDSGLALQPQPSV